MRSRSSARRPVLAGLAFALAGCVHFTPQEIRLTDSADAFAQRSLAAPELHAFLAAHGTAAPADDNWNFEALALAAWYFHPSLDVARAGFERARAAEITAGARPNPTIGFSPGRVANAGSASPWIATLDFDVPIETADKRQVRVAMARHATEAARLRLTDAAWKVRITLREAALEFSDARERIRLVAEQAVKQREMAERLQEKLEAGAIAIAELSAQRSAALRLEQERQEVELRVARSRPRLAAALGVPESALPSSFTIARGDPDHAAEQFAPEEARRWALTSRADLLAALADYGAAQAALQLEVARQFPDVHLGPGYEYDQGDNKWSLGVAIELPVFHRNEGPIAEAEARRQEAAARVLALQATITSEVGAAIAHWRGMQPVAEATARLIAEHQRQRERAAANLAAGAAERLDLLAAEIELAAAELLRWDAAMRRAAALIELEAATQHPLALDFSISPRPSPPSPPAPPAPPSPP